jgi:hypothetical protein
MAFKHPRLLQGELALEAFFHTYNIGDGRGNNYWSNMVNSGSSAGMMNSITPSNSTLYAVPLYLGRRFRLKQYGIGVYSITTGGFDLTIGIYEDTWDPARDFRYPGIKVCDFNITNVTTTGFKSTTFSPPKTLNANKLYWAAFMKNNVGSCAISWHGNYRYPIFHKPLGWTYPAQFPHMIYVATTFGTSLPDPFPASATEDRFSFTMWMREPNQDGT